MDDRRGLPAAHRPGRSAWLGPASLGLGLLAWAVPGAGSALAAAAVVCGVASVRTRGAYRVDATALLGSAAGFCQLALSLVVLGALPER